MEPPIAYIEDNIIIVIQRNSHVLLRTKNLSLIMKEWWLIPASLEHSWVTVKGDVPSSLFLHAVKKPGCYQLFS